MKFITGEDARSQINKQIFAMFNISRLLNSPVNDSINKVQELIDQKIQLEKQVVNLSKKVIEQEIRESNWKTHGNFQFKTIELDQINKPQILEIILPMHKSQFVICFEKNGKFILTSGDQTLTERLFKKLKEFGARGGGTDMSIMGVMKEKHFSNIEVLLFKVIDTLSD